MAKDEATVYIIDDEAEVRESLARLLASANYNVIECASAGEYLLCPAAAGAACILLDVDMPGVTGPELHELLRRRGTSVPIIYLTGRSSISIGVQAMKQGPIELLEKPCAESAQPAPHQRATHRRVRPGGRPGRRELPDVLQRGARPGAAGHGDRRGSHGLGRRSGLLRVRVL